MVAKAGSLPEPVIFGNDNPNISSGLDALDPVVYDPAFYELTPAAAGAYNAWRVAPPNRWARVGTLQGSFLQDFYFRVYVVPTTVDLGNLLSNQSRPVTVWNANFSSVTMTEAEMAAQNGVTFTYPAGLVLPYEMTPLQELVFVVTVGVGGPPQINTTITFTVEGQEYVVPVVGRRVVLFPFPPNWNSAVDETITARSWVIASENGSEQTGSQWGNQPRRQFEYAVVLKNYKQVQRYENLMFSWQSRFFGVPVWTEQSALTGGVSAGALVITFDTFGFTIGPGSLVCLYYDDVRNEIREVKTVVGNTVTLSAGLEFDWPIHSKVFPCVVALLPPAMTASMETTEVGRVPVAFECEPSVTLGNTAPGVAEYTYLGKELFLGKINWRRAMENVFNSDYEKIDANTGRFTTDSLSGFSKQARGHNWTIYGKADAMEFRNFLGRRQGMAHSVFMPSGKPDFSMVGGVADGASSLQYEANGYETLVNGHPARRDIIIVFRDGSFLCRRIASAALEGAVARLQFDEPFDEGFNEFDVERISFLSLCRFASPATTIRWLTNDKGTVDAVMTVKRTED